MAAITKTNQIIPELFAEAVEGAFASQNAFMGSQSANLGIVVAMGTFPQADAKSIGSQVSIPYFGSLGEFASASDGVASTAATSTMTKEYGTIDRGTMNFELTTWAGSVPVPGKSPYEEYARQIVAASTRYADKKVIDAAVAGNNQLVLDVFSATSPRNFDYDLLVDGLGLWGDFGSLDEVAAIAVHSKTMIDMLKLKDSTGRPILVQPNEAGVPPMVFGKPLIVSDRLPVDNSSLTAVTSAGTPVLTLTASTNREGGTGPVRPVNAKVVCTTGGARGTWKFKLSIDGGATYTADDLYTSAATVELTDPLDPAGGKLGITINIAAGTAVLAEYWTFKTILKHTSLLLKKNSLAFWYNASYAGVLQSVPVPANDSVIYAAHLYSVAHRYVRMPGQPLPGVVKIRHNAAGL